MLRRSVEPAIQQRTFAGLSGIVRFVPIATNAPQQIASLFDHLVGAADQRVRDGDAERLGGLQVDDHLDFSGLLDRQIGRLLALENAAGIDAGQAV